MLDLASSGLRVAAPLLMGAVMDRRDERLLRAVWPVHCSRRRASVVGMAGIRQRAAHVQAEQAAEGDGLNVRSRPTQCVC